MRLEGYSYALYFLPDINLNYAGEKTAKSFQLSLFARKNRVDVFVFMFFIMYNDF